METGNPRPRDRGVLPQDLRGDGWPQGDTQTAQRARSQSDPEGQPFPLRGTSGGRIEHLLLQPAVEKRREGPQAADPHDALSLGSPTRLPTLFSVESVLALPGIGVYAHWYD